MKIDFIRSLLSKKSKALLGAKFPGLRRAYNRKFVLSDIGLKRFANNDGNLYLGKGVLPKKLFYKPELSGWLSSEFIDIVCPLLPDKQGITLYPYNEGPYEHDNIRIDAGDIVFDCGANMGLFSIMCANFNCTCYAFEPMPANLKWLKEVVQLNPHIILAPYAINDVDGELWFENSETTSFNTKISENATPSNRIKVDSITLDSYVEKNNIKRVDFIKADIEGAERLLLKGATNILKEFAPKLSICKYHLPDDPEVLRELILKANPSYIIKEQYKKIYAYVP